VRARLSRLAAALLAAAAGASAPPALAHHGTPSVGGLGVEGPGAALDTASPLPLGQGTLFALVKTERAQFQPRAGFALDKRYASFNTLALGYGLTPWLSLFAFQPYNLKAQRELGTNAGVGDTNLMLSASLKWDEGLKLAPRKESLDELDDWHFGLWAACSLPVGPTDHRGAGVLFAPDMQTGFRGPSPGVGLSAMKQLSADFTLLTELSYQRFFDQRYPDTGERYRFGAETRLNGALVWRAWAGAASRIDLAGEASGLHLERDRSDGGGVLAGAGGAAQGGGLVPLHATGGTILYGQLGVRATFGALSLGLGVKRAVARRLNEAADQQGSEGLEDYRAALTIGYSTRL